MQISVLWAKNKSWIREWIFFHTYWLKASLREILMTNNLIVSQKNMELKACGDKQTAEDVAISLPCKTESNICVLTHWEHWLCRTKLDSL